MPPPKKEKSASLDGYEILPIDPIIQLDDISVRLKKLTSVMEKQHEVTVQLLNATLSNSPPKVAPIPLVQKMEELRQEMIQVRAEIVDRRDLGEYRIYRDAATTTPTDLDLIKDYGFPVKGYILSNDGDNTIEIGHMSEPELLDVSDERFYPVFPDDQPWKVIYNIKIIRRIILRTNTGTSNYRLWLFW